MDSVALTPLIMRWMHILCAVVTGGGILFYWLALAPAMRKVLAPEQATALLGAVMGRFKIYVHVSILLFLVSGFYNYMVVLRPLHDGQAIYHALFGVKFLLAIVVFALAVVLTSTRPWSAKLRAGKVGWLVLSVGVTAIVLIGGYMKLIPAVKPAPEAEPAATAAVGNL